MYVSIKDLFLAILYLVAMGALVYFMVGINHLIKTLKNINSLIDKNKTSVNDFCNKLPNISSNIEEISDNIKDISEVATEVTADAIVAKENIVNNYETIKDIINIVLGIFVK